MHTCVYHKQAMFDETLGKPTEKGSSSSTTSMPRSPVRSSCTRQVSPVKYMTLSRPYSELEFFQVCYDQKFPWDKKPSKTSISYIFVTMDVYIILNGCTNSSQPLTILAFDLHNGSRKVSSRGSTVPDLHRSAWSQPGWYLMTAAVSVMPRCVKIMDPFSWHRISIDFR